MALPWGSYRDEEAHESCTPGKLSRPEGCKQRPHQDQGRVASPRLDTGW